MTTSDEADYYRRRADTQRKLAGVAASPVAADAHATLARAYDERADGLSGKELDKRLLSGEPSASR